MMKLYPGYIWAEHKGQLAHCLHICVASSDTEADEYFLLEAMKQFPTAQGFKNHGGDFTTVPQQIIDQLSSYSQGQSC